MADTQSYFHNFMVNLEDSLGANIKAIPKAVILSIIFYTVYKIVNSIFKKYSKKLPLEKDIISIIIGIIDVLIIFFSIMIVASTLGINTSSLIAAFSILGLAVSLSVQNLMSNVANAINIYINRPFKVDDYVDINSIEGNIVQIGLMFTSIRTYKHEMIYIPNSVVGSAIITNYSFEEYRRIEYTIGVSYDNDISTVKKALIEVLNEEPLIEKTKEYTIFVNDYAASSINITLRAYTKNADYLNCLNSVKERIKPKFDKYSINIPYPQLDVFLKNK